MFKYYSLFFQPFFLYLAFQAPHFPHHAPPPSCSGWNNHINDQTRRQYAGRYPKTKLAATIYEWLK